MFDSEEYSRWRLIAFFVAMGIFLIFDVFDASLRKIFFVVLLCIGLIYSIVSLFLLGFLYDTFSTVFVKKNLVVNKNTLRNNICTVVYTPNKQIVVMDNDYNHNNTKQMFTLKDSSDCKLYLLWCKICKFYDERTTVQTLANFMNLDTNVNIVTFATREKVEKTNTVTKEVAVEKTKESPKVESFSNQEKFAKIDVNIATAEEIALLPGVNIVMAKKIVSHRNTKGYFTTKEDFLAVAQVKDCFVDKIKSSIVVDKTPNKDVSEARDKEGRIIDF